MKATSTANDLLAISLSNEEMIILFSPKSMLRTLIDEDEALAGELVLLTPTEESAEDGWLVYIFNGLFKPLSEARPTHILETVLRQHCYRHMDPPATGLGGVFATS